MNDLVSDLYNNKQNFVFDRDFEQDLARIIAVKSEMKKLLNKLAVNSPSDDYKKMFYNFVLDEAWQINSLEHMLKNYRHY